MIIGRIVFDPQGVTAFRKIVSGHHDPEGVAAGVPRDGLKRKARKPGNPGADLQRKAGPACF